MYIGSHISNNERVEAIDFDGKFLIMSDMRLLSVGPMSEFREPKIKVCKVDIKMLLEKICGGPPTFTWLKILIKTRLSKGNPFKITVVIFIWIA